LGRKRNPLTEDLEAGSPLRKRVEEEQIWRSLYSLSEKRAIKGLLEIGYCRVGKRSKIVLLPPCSLGSSPLTSYKIPGRKKDCRGASLIFTGGNTRMDGFITAPAEGGGSFGEKP